MRRMDLPILLILPGYERGNCQKKPAVPLPEAEKASSQEADPTEKSRRLTQARKRGGYCGVMNLYLIIPVGYPDLASKEGVRRPLVEMVPYNKYDRKKHMSNQQIVDYIYELRGKTMPKYIKASGAEDDIHR